MNSYVVSGAAIAGVLLLEKQLRTYTTAGQRAALAEFNAPGPYIQPTIDDAILHSVDFDSLTVVADRALAAAHAGAFLVVVNGQGGEAFNPLDDVSWFLGTNIDAGFSNGYLAGLRESKWLALGDPDASGLSPFGEAVGRVMRARNGSDVHELANAVSTLGTRMDELGVLVSAPKDITPTSWVWDHTVGALIPSTSTLIIGGVAIVAGVYLAVRLGLVKGLL